MRQGFKRARCVTQGFRILKCTYPSKSRACYVDRAESGSADGRGTEEGSADKGSKAETIKLDTERTTAPMPQFEDVSDTVYVKSSDGGSVRIRSACDTGDDSNILTYASPGTGLKRTGKGEQWTRIDYNGTPGYISSGYITTQVPETTAAPPRACVDSGEITLNPSWKYAEFSKIYSGAAVLYRSEAARPQKGHYGLRQCGAWNQGRSFCQDAVSSRRHTQGNRGHHRRRGHLGGSRVRRHDLCRRNRREQGDAVHGKDTEG